MCGFNFKTLENVIANPFDPPNPADPFGSNIHVTDNPLGQPPGAGDLGTVTSGDQRDTTGGAATGSQGDGNAHPSTTTGGLPTDRNFGTETNATLQSLLGMAPGLLGAYQQYSPQFNQSNVNTLGQGLFGGGFSGNLSDINSRLTQQAQTGQGSNASVTTNQITAPGSNSTLDSLMGRAQGTGIDGLLQQQNQLASSQLALGGQLTPDQLRSVQQSSRGGFAARGLDATNASVVNEAMQTQAMQQAMLQQRLAQAGAVEGQNQQATQIQNNLGLGASQQALNYGQLGTAAQQAQGQLTLNTSAQNAALQNQAFGQGQQLFGNAVGQAGLSNATLTNYLNPMNGYASDVYNTNYNAGAAQNIANINAAAGISAGNTQAGAQIGGAALGAMAMMCCWVARECFGTRDNRWLLFRHWLLEYSPRWFCWAYIRYGERFARWLHHHPRVKARVRIWMESKISTLYPHALRTRNC